MHLAQELAYNKGSIKVSILFLSTSKGSSSLQSNSFGGLRGDWGEMGGGVCWKMRRPGLEKSKFSSSSTSWNHY